VLVGHSQGNFIVNGALLGLMQARGPQALAQVRVVNVASSTAWSPFGLDVTLAEDHGVFVFLAGQGLGVPRDTPFCRSAGMAQGCPFRTASATLTSGGVCTTALAAATPFCHNFRATYLSDLPVSTIETRRLATGTFVRGGSTLKERLVDTVFAALDSLDRALPPGWSDDLFGAYFGFNASSPAPGALRLGGDAGGPRAAAVGKASFDQGVAATWTGCLPGNPQGDSWVAFDLRRKDGILPPTIEAQETPLWAIGFGTRAARPGTLYGVFGRSGAAPEVRSARPAASPGGFCGSFALTIGSDGFGSAEFTNAAGGSPLRWRSRAPIAEGVKRLHLSARGATPLTVDALAATQRAFAPPFDSQD
jgi:hypothetical protein